MAKEPENLVLEHLRIIRADIKDLRAEMNGEFRDVRGILGEHSRRFDFLEERVEMLREGTLTANPLCGERGRIYEKAGEANRRPDEGVEKLEQAR